MKLGYGALQDLNCTVPRLGTHGQAIAIKADMISTEAPAGAGENIEDLYRRAWAMRTRAPGPVREMAERIRAIAGESGSRRGMARAIQLDATADFL
jgi:hypothetical protein